MDGFEEVTPNEARILGHYSDDDRNISKKKARTEPERVQQARLVVKQARGKQAKASKGAGGNCSNRRSSERNPKAEHTSEYCLRKEAFKSRVTYGGCVYGLLLH